MKHSLFITSTVKWLTWNLIIEPGQHHTVVKTPYMFGIGMPNTSDKYYGTQSPLEGYGIFMIQLQSVVSLLFFSFGHTLLLKTHKQTYKLVLQKYNQSKFMMWNMHVLHSNYFCAWQKPKNPAAVSRFAGRCGLCPV